MNIELHCQGDKSRIRDDCACSLFHARRNKLLGNNLPVRTVVESGSINAFRRELDKFFEQSVERRFGRENGKMEMRQIKCVSMMNSATSPLIPQDFLNVCLNLLFQREAKQVRAKKRP